MIAIFTGLPGAGKSLKLARTALQVLERNVSWEKDKKNVEHVRRKLFTNLVFRPWVYEEFQGYIEHWTDTSDLVKLRDVDVLWDEMAAAMDATQWQNMSLELKRWLQQHRKYGIEIYGTAQDFAQVDKSARRLVSDLVYITKLCGSKDPSPTIAPPKRIWGFCMLKTLDPQNYNEEKSKFEGNGELPNFMWFGRKDVDVFDTRAEVPVGQYPPLRHVYRTCELPGCDHVKISHL